MKHFLLSSFLWILLLPGGLDAQVKWHIGGGVNNTRMDLSGDLGVDVESSFRSDYFISVRPEISLSEDLSVSMDAQYSRKQYMMSPSLFVSEENVKTRMSFVEVIPQIEYTPVSYVGLYGGFGVARLITEINKLDDAWTEFEIPLSKKYIASWVIGLRVRPADKLSIQIHFSDSISDIFDVEFTDVTGNPLDIRSRLTNIQVGLTYQIF